MAALALATAARRRPGPGAPAGAAGLPGHRPHRPATTAALGLLLGLATGARARELDRSAPFVRGLPEAPARLDLAGTIRSADPPGRGGVAFVLDVERVTDGRGTTGVDLRLDGLVGGFRARGSESAAGPSSDGPPLAPGDVVTLAGIVESIPPPTNPGVYDARAAAARRGIDARVVVPDGRGVVVLRHGDGPAAAVARARTAVAAALDDAFTPDDAGLLRSLCLGDRGALAPDDRRRFREAGAAHILAISGSHVALLTATMLWMLRRARIPPRLAALVVIVGTLLLVPFTGSAPPVVRSAAGFVLFLGGRLLGREPTGTTLLAIVAAGYAVLDPGTGSDPGFRMSFAAAGGLILLAPRIRRVLVPDTIRLPGAAPPKALVRTALAAGLAAWLSSTPFAVAALGQAGFVAVPVGLVAVPLSTLALVGGAAAAALRAVPVLGFAARRGIEGVLAGLRWFLDRPAALGCGTGPVEPPTLVWYLAYLAAIVGLARGGARVASVSAFVLLVLLVDLGARSEPRPPAGVRLTLLDVGHGQAALLETSDGRRALLDAGSRDRRDVAERVVLPALFALRATTLDLASASHADDDHAGALPAVLDEVPTGTIIVPPRFDPAVRAALEATHRPVVAVADGDGLLAGPWGRLVVLGPRSGAAPGASRNDDCLVLAIETPWGSIVLPGDREARGVETLLATHPDLRADVLVLPHHGHPNPGRERLIAATAPGTRLASAPPSALARLPEATRATGREGALVLTLDAAGLRVDAPFASRRPTDGEYDRPLDPMHDPLTLASAAAALAVVGFVAVRLAWLTRGGAAGAVVLGFAGVLAFGWPALAALLAPFVVATLAGKLPGGDPGEGPRTLRQVAANGLVSFAGALVGIAGAPTVGLAVFLGGLAALGADTLATEFGTRYGGTPRSLATLRPLARGESGGVTIVGLVASVAGACLAPIAYVAALGGGTGATRAVLVLAGAGFVAGLADSALGAALQRKGRCAACGAIVESAAHCGAAPAGLPRRLGWLDNDVVNLANGLVGAALAVAFL